MKSRFTGIWTRNVQTNALVQFSVHDYAYDRMISDVSCASTYAQITANQLHSATSLRPLTPFVYLRVRFGDFINERRIVGLREPTLFIQKRQDSHRLLQQIDGWLQIETKVDELPFDPLALVLLLF